MGEILIGLGRMCERRKREACMSIPTNEGHMHVYSCVWPSTVFFPTNGIVVFWNCVLCVFSEKWIVGAGFFTNLPSFPPLQSNPLHFIFQSTPPPRYCIISDHSYYLVPDYLYYFQFYFNVKAKLPVFQCNQRILYEKGIFRNLIYATQCFAWILRQ